MGNASPRLDITAGRVRRRFAGHQLDAIYPVCWPVYRVRLTVTVLERSELSTTAHYILKLVNLGIGEPDELGRMLGLTENYVAGAAAELLRDDLSVQGPDLHLVITQKGKQVISNNGQAMRPKTQQVEVPFDPLTRKVLDIDLGGLLNQDEVRKEELFIVNYLGDKPRLNDLRIEEIKAYNSHNTSDDRIEQEIIDVSEIRSRNARLQYRKDTVIAKLVNPNAGEVIFAAYQGHQYLDDETTMLQRLSERGVNLTPGEFEGGPSQAWLNGPSVSVEEVELLSAIEGLDAAASEAEQMIAETEAARGETGSAEERDALTQRITEMEVEKHRLADQLANTEAELNRRTEGTLCLIKTEDHHPLLLDAIDQASEELTLVSAWIDPYAFDTEVRRKLAEAVKRGVIVRIAWGFGVGRRSADSERNLKKGEDALARLKQLVPGDAIGRLIVKRTETHEKFIICDDQFCVWGSFNWLSYRGEIDQGYRRETSTYSSRPDDIILWKENAATLFQSG